MSGYTYIYTALKSHEMGSKWQKHKNYLTSLLLQCGTFHHQTMLFIDIFLTQLLHTPLLWEEGGLRQGGASTSATTSNFKSAFGASDGTIHGFHHTTRS